MEISVMTKEGLHPVRGGYRQLLTRIEAVEQLRAGEHAFGLAKVTNAADVTAANGGLVLPAMQNNAALPGTLANRIISVRNALDKKIGYTDIEDFETGMTVEEPPISAKWARSETGRWYLLFYVGDRPVLKIAGFTTINQ